MSAKMASNNWLVVWPHFWAGYNWNGPRTHLVPWLKWSPRNLVSEKFEPQEIWAPRSLGPVKFGPCMKIIIILHFHSWNKILWSGNSDLLNSFFLFFCRICQIHCFFTFCCCYSKYIWIVVFASNCNSKQLQCTKVRSC